MAERKSYHTIYYNLDMIISLEFSVKSKIAMNFRRWITERLKKSMIKGFMMDDERLKNLALLEQMSELFQRDKTTVLWHIKNIFV